METWASFRVGGQRLHGMLHLPDIPRPAAGFPAVVMLHGFTGHRSESHRLFVLLSRYLMRLGMASLRFDFRGSGDSEGDFSEMTVSREVEDALEAVAYVRDLPEIDAARVAVLGFSLGGMVAALAAERARPERLALCAPATPEVMLRTLPFGQVPAGIADRGGWPVGREFYLELPRLDPVAALQRYRGPVRVFHGDADTSVPLEAGVRYARAAGAELIAFPGAGHTFDSLRAVEDFQREVARFLTMSL
ncbi:hypothetical protein HNR42_001973 [Deinobacterium chartae]|uniref:Peptidase S9 prolyl oligopeptidase catalytic domain-containing protein n=1 Tax=Deinobacterium chartae TaxID=521158 RepID=A0A841I2C5_9DEIO|nr:alpha/beta fold hydrolase [Deinobacterium chartae]MBB6098539.1 hypothetical protein [Deinobacterium chartae]